MTTQSYIKGKQILAVDDEEDILEIIEEILSEAQVDTARDYASAVEKIQGKPYDLAILDIMGVDGLKLLEDTVKRGIPTVMLTAHAVNAESFMESIRKGAMAYLPKEKLADLDELLNRLLGAHEEGIPTWKLLFDMLGGYFDQRFGPNWKKQDPEFWNEFDRTIAVGKGIRERLLHDDRIRNKGI
jgi:CheY-like chemotaxis protein